MEYVFRILLSSFGHGHMQIFGPSLSPPTELMLFVFGCLLNPARMSKMYVYCGFQLQEAVGSAPSFTAGILFASLVLICHTCTKRFASVLDSWGFGASSASSAHGYFLSKIFTSYAVMFAPWLVFLLIPLDQWLLSKDSTSSARSCVAFYANVLAGYNFRLNAGALHVIIVAHLICRCCEGISMAGHCLEIMDLFSLGIVSWASMVLWLWFFSVSEVKRLLQQ